MKHRGILFNLNFGPVLVDKENSTFTAKSLSQSFGKERNKRNAGDPTRGRFCFGSTPVHIFLVDLTFLVLYSTKT